VIDWLEERINLSEILSWITTFGISYAPISRDQPVREAARHAFLEPLPSRFRWQLLNLLTFATFLLEVASGLLLALYYQPTVDTAYESTRMIIRDTSYGWYVHQTHYWGGQVLLVLLVFRLIRAAWRRWYHTPFELNWILTTILFYITLQITFTGQLLPWDQNSYWSTMRGLEFIQRIPVLGAVLNYFAGGFAVGPFLLLRFYLIHIVFLPLLAFAFFYLSFATARRIIRRQPERPNEKYRTIFPDHTLNLMMILMFCFGGLISLAILFPDSFQAKADPFHTPGNISIPWYLLPVYGLYELVNPAAGGWIVFLVFLFTLTLPFVDHWLEGRWKKGEYLKWVIVLMVIAGIFLTYYGFRIRG
jgi:quinol-cytochrome oxidoreductase complex cytochrome b subunit